MSASTPKPDYSPQEVVRIQLDALKHNDQPGPDAGIAKVFQFASPENQAKTGPLDRFAAMVKGDTYGALVNHQTALYAKLQGDDRQVQQLVQITAADGSVAWYVFVLRKQGDGKFKDCWMTDGVIRVSPDQGQPVAPAPPGRNGDGRDKA
jgi:hypothetical protein